MALGLEALMRPGLPRLARFSRVIWILAPSPPQLLLFGLADDLYEMFSLFRRHPGHERLSDVVAMFHAAASAEAHFQSFGLRDLVDPDELS